MARVRSFAPSTQRLRAHDTFVDCEVGIVGSGSTQLLHLTTFGSDDRASERKSSQSIQLDAAHAAQLISILGDFLQSATTTGHDVRPRLEIPRKLT